MKINFNEMPVTDFPKFKGGEKSLAAKMFSDGKVKIMRGTLVPGASIGLHTHDTSCEAIFIISGTGKMIYDDTEEKLEAGDCHYCENKHTHSLINDSSENLVFFAVIPELGNQ
ncbi:MAG: cupin domain-containing protein [Treponema sp.]|nr:cupin domain-containing protein [Treponema sp.]